MISFSIADAYFKKPQTPQTISKYAPGDGAEQQ